MCRIRLYLTSRCKPVLSSEVNQSDVQKPAESGCSSYDETELRAMLTTENQLMHTRHDTLIRSSEQYERIKSEQDIAYLASLSKEAMKQEEKL